MSDKPKVDVYTASDYAGMEAGPWSFYYGYEWDYVINEDRDERDLWGFRAKRDGVEVLSLSSDALIARAGRRAIGNGEPVDLLLAGIALTLAEQAP